MLIEAHAKQPLAALSGTDKHGKPLAFTIVLDTIPVRQIKMLPVHEFADKTQVIQHHAQPVNGGHADESTPLVSDGANGRSVPF